MSNYATGNPVPSNDPRDLDDNATVFDVLLTGNLDFYPDRLGNLRRSWFRMEQDAQALGSPNVSSLAALTLASNKGLYSTGPGALSTYNLTLLGRALSGASTEVDARSAIQAAKAGINTDITSISGSAASLTTGRTIAATGDASWSVSFNGSTNATGALTLATTGVTAGSYREVTVDAKGRVTAGANSSATIAATGDATWSVTFNGANATGALTLATTGVTAGSYREVTVDAKGRVTAGSNPGAAIALTLQNGWSVPATFRSIYRSIGSLVFIEIAAAGGRATDSTVLATLPSGARPAVKTIVPVAAAPNTPISSTVVVPRVVIDTNGEIRVQNCTSAPSVFFTATISTI